MQSSCFAQKLAHPEGKLSLAKRSLEPRLRSHAGAWEREEKNFQRITGAYKLFDALAPLFYDT
jgi:hypothetical protein